MYTLWQDLRFGFRTLMKRPLLLIMCVLSLGLGIGANTTIFSMVKAIMLQPLTGIAEPDQLLLFLGRRPTGSYSTISYPDYLDFRERNDALAGLIAYEMVPLNMSTSGEAERVWGMIVSDNYFSMLGVQPVLGRAFTREEGQAPGAHPVAVISHRLWNRSFGSDPNIIGKTVTLNGYSYTVIGVAPENFAGTFVALSFDIWVPLSMQEQIKPGVNLLNARGSRWLESMARLKPGYSIEQGQAAMTAIANQLQEVFPDTNKDRGVTLLPLSKAPWGPIKILSPVLLVLTLAVGLLLLIACANVANLLLLRALGRWREIAIRLSLGATRSRLIKQFLTESILLAVMGGIAGLVLAIYGTSLLSTFAPPASLPIKLNVEIDKTVLGFTALISVLTGIIFGMAPALQTTHPDLVSSLKDESVPLTKGYSKSRIRKTLVVVQIALCQVLLITAALFVLSLQKAQTINPGFDSQNLLLGSIDLANKDYNKERATAFYRQLIERTEAIPGVQSASLASAIPLGFSGGSSVTVTVDGYTPQANEDMRVEFNLVGPKYFQTLGIPLLQGRDFTLQDAEGAPAALIINESMAKRYWPGQDPLGRSVRFGDQVATVIGVATDGKYASLSENPKPYMYRPLLQLHHPTVTLHARTHGDPVPMIGALRSEVRAADPTLALYDIKTMTQHLEIAVLPQTIAGTLLTVFGLIALALAAIGIYSIMAYAVRQRTREIAIRLALGAQHTSMLGMIIKEGLVLALIATGIGLIAVFNLTRILSNLLLGVNPTQVLTFTAISLLLIMMSLVASYIPARRIMKINLSTALRTE